MKEKELSDWDRYPTLVTAADPADATGDLNGAGYTNIEKYLNGLDPSVRVNWSDLAHNTCRLSAGKP